MKGQVVHASIHEWTSARELLIHCPRAIGVVFDERGTPEAIVMNVIDLAEFAAINDLFNEFKLVRQARMTTGRLKHL